MPSGPRLRVVPLTAARWADLDALFGKSGAYGGCWCMYWRIPRSRFSAQAGAGNRAAFRRLVRELSARGVATLYLTSEIREARALAHRLLVMSGGQIVKQVSPATEEEEIMAAAGGADV